MTTSFDFYFRLEIKAKEDERIRHERMKAERKQKFRERQKEQWAHIRCYRRNQEEIKAERRFHLHQELKASVKARRERALQVRRSAIFKKWI